MTRFHALTSSTAAAFLMAACALFTNAHAQSPAGPVVSTDQVRAELMVHAPDGLDPGKTVWLGLQLAHQPHWHTYWKNPGDSGLPTVLQWTLPAGMVAGEIAWPTPKKIPIGNLANYGYEDTVLLPVPVTITPDFKPPLIGGSVPIKLKASWLICRKECIPQDGEFVLSVAVRGSTALNAAAFEATWKGSPKALAGESKVELDGNAIKVSVTGLPAGWQGKTLDFFPETPEVIETAAAWTQAWQDGVWTAQVPLSAYRAQSPTVMPLVLAWGEAAQRAGLATSAKVSGVWPKVAPLEGLAPGLEAALKANASAAAAPPSQGVGMSVLWLALAGALLGGMILNLMPCVFPVLAIKVMGFTKHAGDRRGHRISGFAYTLGVVLSFLALGALMLGLRSAGEQLGWGFHLQSPGVVAALAVLFTVIGLNLAGLFEFGQFLPSRLATLEARNPALNSMLTGVLAAAVASPCTAPFMGASLGLALGLPASQALLIFATIGLGMALPYLAASLVPGVARALPRPGAWMKTFRHAMAFPMFVTVAWLVWVLGQQSGIDGAGALLALLVGLSMVMWSLTLPGRARSLLATVSGVALGLMLFTAGPYVVKPLVQETVSSPAGRWQAWEPGKVAQILASGQPVFVDFTAAWCVTCQYNKQTTLSDVALMADMQARKVVLLRADWTRRDPAITAALAQLGRNGVPVYVLQAPGRAPLVLSEILSVAEVRAALAAM
ncbi:protein-disulfide reductase DsbD family protein [Rhodoferax sp.]|uniref:protein-disulfide reductase DsbD family protein n=1 Tax=Rhodoferax sp. TaxID=50421 RepID=UPI002767B8B1|nr:protein-disulfide reductase DsbD family protein [Rhodoferax sp.]